MCKEEAGYIPKRRQSHLRLCWSLPSSSIWMEPVLLRSAILYSIDFLEMLLVGNETLRSGCKQTRNNKIPKELKQWHNNK